ncbi:MAG: hypothetical protein FWH57_07750 [Oscillospiraceae bacterium]|nr:hypothetical protein [Oscillospiraceae bacterium]
MEASKNMKGFTSSMDRITREAAESANVPYPLDDDSTLVSIQIISSIEQGIAVATDKKPPKNDIMKYLEELQRRADKV